MSLGDNTLETPSNESMTPSLQLSDTRGSRYPNQFFDLAQQYMPPTMKELLRWCTFYFYNSPLIGATMKKKSKYPITDLIYEDDQESTRKLWEEILDDKIKIKERLIEINLDRNVYGNAFVSVHLPFTRFLICKKCGESQPIKNWDWNFRGSEQSFTGKCSKCDHQGPVEVKDKPYKDIGGIRIIRWNPENMHIKYNEYTGRYIYMYTVPPKLKNMILRGDKDILEDIPLIVIEALKKRRMIRVNADNLFHLKSPTLAEQDQGWGKPDIIHVLKDMYYLYTLRRSQEAIAMEHIIPCDIIYPLPNAQQDPYLHTDLSDWRIQIETIIRKHRRDPNFKGVIPVPVGTARIGGDGKMLMLSPELSYLNQTIVGGLGMSAEMLFGNGTTYCLEPKSYVFTSKGLLQLQEFCPEDLGIKESKLRTVTKDSIENIKLVHHTEPRSQVKIRTRMGLKLNGSPIHRVWCLLPDMSMDWVKLQDLKPGMFTAAKRAPGLWGTETPSPELCRLLGHLCSDGSVLNGSVIFRSTDSEDLKDYQQCLNNIFGKDSKIYWRKYEDQKDLGEIETQDKNIYSQLVNLGLEGYQSDKKIPRIIRESTKECVAEFLRSLFSGDGCIEDKDSKQSIIYTSVSEELLDQVQLLLLNMGIVSRRQPAYEESCPRLVIHSYNVTKFMSEVGFTLDRKTTLYNDAIVRDNFRCEENKYPYLADCLRDLRKKVTGNGWIQQKLEIELTQEVYNLKEVAKMLGRSNFATICHIKSGKLKATKDMRDRRWQPYVITKLDLQDFLDNHGVYKRMEIGDTKVEINTSNMEGINWENVKELDPLLYNNFQEVKKSDHIWDEVVEVTHSNEEIEMCDLTIENTPSYVANGLISHNTGSSITLRMLENDFIQDRSQLLSFVTWLKNKIRIWTGYPNLKNIRFSDFRMADDVQRNQQLIGLNAQAKISDDTMLTELGFDWIQECQKMVQEAQFKNYLMDLQTKGSAKSQGEASMIQANYQKKMQDLMGSLGINPQDGQASGQPMQQDQAGGGQVGQQAGQDGQNQAADLYQSKVQSWANKLMQVDPATANSTLSALKAKMPEVGMAIETQMQLMRAGQGGASAPGMETSAVTTNKMQFQAKANPGSV